MAVRKARASNARARFSQAERTKVRKSQPAPREIGDFSEPKNRPLAADFEDNGVSRLHLLEQTGSTSIDRRSKPVPVFRDPFEPSFCLTLVEDAPFHQCFEDDG